MKTDTDYTVRRSTRARHVWLRFSRHGDLIVVVPQRFDVRRVPAVVEANRDWIHRAASRVQSRREATAQSSTVALPARIDVPALGQEWTMEYRPSESTRVTVSERPGHILLLSGNTCDLEACRTALLRWLRRTAHKHLVPMLKELAAETGFSPVRVTVRSQRTRWASCSRKGSISLNVRLLFVPPMLVRHIMLHELCHTKRMDHSQRFWKLLERHDPNWRENRRGLRAAWRVLPVWLNRHADLSSE